MQEGAESINSTNSGNNEIIEMYEVEGTPFKIVRTPEGVFGAIGEHRITDIGIDPEILEERIRMQDWEMLINVIIVLIKQINKEK